MSSEDEQSLTGSAADEESDVDDYSSAASSDNEDKPDTNDADEEAADKDETVVSWEDVVR